MELLKGEGETAFVAKKVFERLAMTKQQPNERLEHLFGWSYADLSGPGQYPGVLQVRRADRIGSK